MPVTGAEANIYICEYNGREYVAKIYKRKDASKTEIIEKLKDLDSPNIAKIYETGEYNGLPVTILPYYKLGSLQGKKFGMQQLKRMLIPCINEALHSLHKLDIFHRDLKPANIIMLSNGRGVALIDFVISSVTDRDESVVVSKIGFTTDYAATETLRGVYSVASDYYYLELLCMNYFVDIVLTKISVQKKNLKLQLLKS